VEGTEVKLAAIDIGTNSMRLLIVHQIGDDLVELGRWQRVTALGAGVDATGLLLEEAIDRTMLALAEFGARMRDVEVERRRAVATSASRDASNRELFFDKAEVALGVRPELISGDEEARLAFSGATFGVPVPPPHIVVDIGGGSTEFVTVDGGRSLEMGSVRLTERVLDQRPPSIEELAAARGLVQETFAGVAPTIGSVLGVAGTWTSLAGIHRGDPEVHLASLTAGDVSGLVEKLAHLSAEQTAALPGYDPARAHVILSGAVIAEGCLSALGAREVTVSNHDLLDGVVSLLREPGW
jgi:exopolyphosphatase / guanosine-5'-triphosphate,3'-diphosphate pyrophosphatase